MLSKHKRKFSRSIPFLFLTLILLFYVLSGIYFVLPNFFNNSFISPLAINGPYKGNSIEDLLSKNNIQFSKVQTASDSSYIVFLKDDGQVRLPSNKDMPSQISSLQLILYRLTIEGKKFKSLDLRFDKPVIEF